MIPKIIHYCWFGNGTMPLLSEKCMKSWRKYCPDYGIKVWNESNFDVNCNSYVKQAYDAGKYAFVSDYARLFVLYKYGGIYMDTDVEVLKPLDSFLETEAFSGFETSESVTGGILACTPQHPFFGLLLSYYDGRNFIKSDCSYDLTTNVTTITDYCVKNGLKLDNTLQTINGFTLYPKEYFSPKDFLSGKISLSPETCTIHHFAGSWICSSDKWKMRLYRLLGPKLTNKIIHIKKTLKNIE